MIKRLTPQSIQLALTMPEMSAIPHGSNMKWASVTPTFTPNMRLPVHGWFRFSAGFSAEWVRDVVGELRRGQRDLALLDPFAGVGTAVLAGEEAGVTAFGLEAQPFTAKIAGTKLLWHTSVQEFSNLAYAILQDARNHPRPLLAYPVLVEKCFPPAILQDLHNLKCAWEEARDSSAASELTWLALCAVLRICSPVGTAPWQYVLPAKAKARTLPPYEAFSLQVDRMVSDMLCRQAQGVEPRGNILLSDARDCAEIAENSIDIVITSPPYTNNYDYADATRLEMSFFGNVTSWGDLHQKVRSNLVRSCSQHVSAEKLDLTTMLDELAGTPIRTELERTCAQLATERMQHGGKKDYHLMVAAYFADLHRVWRSLRRVCKEGATVCFVIGDSAPYGVHVPVDRWLGQLAVAAGFHGFRFEKVRDRNIKWKNRKHRVPLHEGRLWVEG